MAAYSSISVINHLLCIPWALFGILLFLQPLRAQQNEDIDYYHKWLREDVIYIITPEEGSVFSKLQTDDERENFIEQFWRRRDSDPRTAHNEFKEEHYRRIAYANENFHSGIQGWRTDRGLIYIKFGPPDSIDSNPSGGAYDRPSWEGGGSTMAYPFEKWDYRYLEGVGQDVEIEFVDQSMTGKYELTTNPQDKDALLHLSNVGLTDAEAMGLVRQKVDRIVQKSTPTRGNNPLVMGYGRLKDQPFEKLQLLSNLHRAPVNDFKDLKADIQSQVFYDHLPFEIRSDVFRGNAREGIAIVTLTMQNTDLNFVRQESSYKGKIEIYGVVKSLSGQIVKEIGDSMDVQMSPQEYKTTLSESLVYQKDLWLPPGRYKLEFYVKDPAAPRLGNKQSLVLVPPIEETELQISSVMMARRIETLPNQGEVFKIWPLVKNRLDSRVKKVGFYYELYNVGFDQSSGETDLALNYSILNSSGERLELDPILHSIDPTPGRVQVLGVLPGEDLKPGPLKLEIQVRDSIAKKELKETVAFRLDKD